VLLFAILFGFALMALGARGKTLLSFIDDVAHGVFGVINIVMKVAPLGAFGAMASRSANMARIRSAISSASSPHFTRRRRYSSC